MVNSQLVQKLTYFSYCRVLILLTLLWAAVAPAQTALDAEIDAAFEAMFEDPGSIDRILNYASLATRAGDYEAAIGALERILMISPGLPGVHTDLGLLYQRMGSLETARFHIEKALAAPELTLNVELRARRVLDRIDTAQGKSTLRGSITLGLQYQSNANSGPSSATGLASGFPVSLDDEFLEEDDFNMVFLGRARHTYQLSGLGGATLETNGFIVGALYKDLNEINYLTTELSTGPRIKAASVQGLDFRPHILANIASRGNEPSSKSFGLGMDMRYTFGSRGILSARYQHRWRDFKNSDDRPRNDQRDGNEDHFIGNLIYSLRDNLTGVVRVTAIDRSTQLNYRDTFELGIIGRLILTHNSPLSVGPKQWRSNVLLGLRSIEFDAPDPLVDPTRAREDDEIRLSAGTAVEFARNWVSRVQLSYSDVDSNIVNFERDNFSVLITTTRRF